jgi:diacylglycerol kinase (ATP)
MSQTHGLSPQEEENCCSSIDHPMRVTLIHNPNAGDDRQPSAGQLIALIKEAGYKVRYQSTDEKGWPKILKRSAGLVVVAGGDGTVGRVARRLIGKDLPIAVLPMGTANNISKTLGISEMTVTQLIPLWKSARHLKFDAGLARGPWGERHFIEGVGTGLLTHSIPKVSGNKTLKRLQEADAKVSYAQQLFREYVADSPALDLSVMLDGRDISGRYVLFEVLNMQYVGPNLFLAPDVVRNNGEFEVIRITESQRKQLHNYIKTWQEGTPWPHAFKTLRGRRLEIKWTGFKFHIDDSIWPPDRKSRPKSPATFELTVERAAVEFLVPAAVHAQQKLARRNARQAKTAAQR